MGPSNTGMVSASGRCAEAEEAQGRLNHYSRNICMQLAYDYQRLRCIQAVYDIRLGRLNSIKTHNKVY